MILEQVGVLRTQTQVINKITTMETQYRLASDWLGQTGAGVECQTSIKKWVMGLCPNFYDLQDVMVDRASTRPLCSSGCDLESQEDEDAIVDRLFHSDDDDEKSTSDMTSPLQSTPSGKKRSAKKRIKGVVVPWRKSQHGEENGPWMMMLNIKRKQVIDEAKSREDTLRLQQLEVDWPDKC